MLFNTIDFVIFLPIVVVFYYVIPGKFRWIFLLIASYYFYMSWNVQYIYLILFSTIVDYLVGLRMGNLSSKKAKLPWLIISITMNLGLLFTFKYLDFATENLNIIFNQIGINKQLPIFHLLLPVGISFYTFQTLSYAVDIYNNRIKPEKHFGYFALYVSFFPQLVAGPIERFDKLNPQFKQKTNFTYQNFANGGRLILYGLFIKMVVADNISGFVDSVYLTPQLYHAVDVWKAMIFYSFQIYSDFYGYSLIAIGSAMLLGIYLMDNFKTPYLAKNIAEFWQRWHISLSTWFRDYVYFPLGGNKTTTSFWLRNIIIVFVLSGIWHGANWTFFIWGALYAIIYILEKIFAKYIKAKDRVSPFSITHLLLALKTFVLVTLVWVFFRSPSFSDALEILKAAFRNWGVFEKTLTIPLSTTVFFGLFILSDILLYNNRFDKWIDKKPYVMRWSIYGLLLFSIIVFAGVENFPFIYFQF
ncbi:MAG: MBOAT family O-acyltransferase [Putridiphycobacter sp.]|nr:MBOAT family O-acyltransferase [Putridiphycobacter sp.]